MTITPIVAHSHPFVVGVDTHARNHVYAILAANTGALLATREFPTTAAGNSRAMAWAAAFEREIFGEFLPRISEQT